MNKVRIAGATVSKTGITLYLETGKEMNLPIDSWRTKAIMDNIKDGLARKQIVEIDLDTYSVESHIEKRSNGLIKFFRTTVSAISGLFSGNSGGVVDQSAPALDPKKETVVAVVAGKQIPGIEHLERHMEHAYQTNNTVGLQKFLERIAKVIDGRGHTVNELLHFMSRGDLPIADDGSIIAYKVLCTNGRKDGVFVDCHSRKVTQKLGSRVSMDEKLVNPSRRTECSTGLHIARRAYISGFPGDIITLVKVAPEDVIAVPFNEPNKMRAAAYHIVAVLPSEVHELLRSNKAMTSNTKAALILADVIAGRHVDILENVIIGSAYGGDIKIVPVDGAQAEVVAGTEKAVALDDVETKTVVTVKDVQKAVKAAVAEKQAESAQERRNRVKRERRSEAKKPKAQPAAPAKKAVKKIAAAKTAAPKVTKKVATPAVQLTPIQRQALDMLAAGKSQREIEKVLTISAKTIRKLVRAGIK